MKKIVSLVCFICLVLFSTQVFSQSITFAVLSDTHYSVSEKNKTWKQFAFARKTLPQLLKKLSHDPGIDFVVFPGDLFMDPLASALDPLKTLIDTHLKKPYFVIPGNHDRPTKDQINEKMQVFSLMDFVKTFKGHPYPDGVTSYWSLDYNGYHLIGLDSTKDEPLSGRVSRAQVAWLREDLKKNRDKFTIIFVHHGLDLFCTKLPMERGYTIDNYREVQKIIKNNPQVKFVVTGHYHFSAVRVKDEVYHLTMPTLVTYPLKYAVFHVEQNRVLYQTIKTGTKDQRAKAANGLVEEPYWRKKFKQDADLIRFFEGIDSLTFQPRP
ncbi:MAG: metallophosphoesterase [Deltaproteobacteria bacterium]|nr:metallophosphoesterase [Deltaproteobacteria bacterium]